MHNTHGVGPARPATSSAAGGHGKTAQRNALTQTRAHAHTRLRSSRWEASSRVFQVLGNGRLAPVCP
eukprot:4704957-Pleurochrysis_carterae.AAC.5